jgi:hypothetical protein
MDAKPKQDPGPEQRTRGVIRMIRGHDRNRWAKPPGQRPDRLNPPACEAP